jgi:hypothetical protein
MVRRNAFLAVVSAGMSLAVASFAASAFADQRNNPPSSPDTAGYTYPTQQSLDSGVYDLTSVEANRAAAIAEEDRAEMELNITVIRLQKDFETSPEYKAAVQELDQAHQALDSARSSVLDQVAGDPRYQQLSDKHDRIAAVLEDGGLSPRDLYDLAQRKMEYGSDARKMEASALNNSSDVQSARSRLVSAQQKMDDLRDRFSATIYQNPQWASAKQSLDNARIAKAAALGAEQGAFITAAVAANSAAIRSAYGYYNANQNNPYNSDNGFSASYYPRY